MRWPWSKRRNTEGKILKPKEVLTAGKARERADFAVQQIRVGRQHNLLESIAANVKNGQTSIRFYLEYSPYTSISYQKIDKEDVPYLENLGYKVEQITEEQKIPKYPYGTSIRSGYSYGISGDVGVLTPPPEYNTVNVKYVLVSW